MAIRKRNTQNKLPELTDSRNTILWKSTYERLLPKEGFVEKPQRGRFTVEQYKKWIDEIVEQTQQVDQNNIWSTFANFTKERK